MNDPEDFRPEYPCAALAPMEQGPVVVPDIHARGLVILMERERVAEEWGKDPIARPLILE